MNLLLDFCYLAALAVFWPVLLYKSLRTGKYRADWAGRLGRVTPWPRQPQTRRLMIHTVSVGELLSVRLLVDRLLEASPELEILITTTTDTGTARARELFAQERYQGRVRNVRYPLDLSWAVGSFLRRLAPDAAALVELETWPNFLRICEQRGIPVVIINGRLTERALGRYRLIKPVVTGMFQRIAWFGIQTEEIAERFRQLGAPAQRMSIVPTLKYDSADLSDRIPNQERLAAALGIDQTVQLFVAGSTAPGEEQPLLATYQALQPKYPRLRLALAPRKPETLPGLLQAIAAAGFTPLQRTQHPDGSALNRPPQPTEILILDTLGELKKLYALAFAVFVGRTLVNLGGSDMIEAVALGKPTCFGPHTHNFAEAVKLLTHGETPGAVVVQDETQLRQTVQSWLENPPAAETLGRQGRTIIAAQRGSTTKYVEKLLALVKLNPVGKA